ncbi:MAG: hypothetical protein WC364_12420 [Eubacteriales bacterium]|jgi:hypothetical protein
MDTLHTIKAVGSEDGRFVQILVDQGKKWVEIDPADGTIKREIKPRRFVEYDDAGNITTVHNINYSELLETQGVEAFLAGKKGFEVTDKELKAVEGKDMIATYKVTEGRLEEKPIVKE